MIDVYVCVFVNLEGPPRLDSPFPYHFAVVLDRKQWWLLATSIFDSEQEALCE